jgi:hypothetical protein
MLGKGSPPRFFSATPATFGAKPSGRTAAAAAPSTETDASANDDDSDGAVETAQQLVSLVVEEEEVEKKEQQQQLGEEEESRSEVTAADGENPVLDAQVSRESVLQQQQQQPNQPDLFEYFDPLLSPHAYPNGIVPPERDVWIGPSSPPPNDDGASALGLDNVRYLGVPHPDPIRYRTEDYQDSMKLDNLNFLGVGTHSNSWPRDSQGLPIVDAYRSQFDPTLSPHAYPQGAPRDVVESKREDGPGRRGYGDRGDAVVAALKDNIDASATVDGMPPAPDEYRPPLVGILLIDHGSKSEASNRVLHDMASLYQDSVGSVVVQAAHMELARPSVQEGMERLLERGVDEIVCHPYCLGPGRHVTEDIPRLVRDATDALGIEIPVRTTAHVGSDATAMLEAVHATVRQTSTLFAPSRTDRL